MINITTHPNLKKDEDTGAVINTDDSAYREYLLNKKLKFVDNELNTLKEELHEIKTLLRKLVE